MGVFMNCPHHQWLYLFNELPTGVQEYLRAAAEKNDGSHEYSKLKLMCRHLGGGIGKPHKVWVRKIFLDLHREGVYSNELSFDTYAQAREFEQAFAVDLESASRILGNPSWPDRAEVSDYLRTAWINHLKENHHELRH
jgi:hypothetical protein